jgi:hypothetical protein
MVWQSEGVLEYGDNRTKDIGGLAIGVALGAALGIALKNMALGLAMGILLGVVFFANSSRTRTK